VIYTTNAIEALNRHLRKALKTRATSPTRRPLENSSTSPSSTRDPHWTRTRNRTTALLAFKIHS